MIFEYHIRDTQLYTGCIIDLFLWVSSSDLIAAFSLYNNAYFGFTICTNYSFHIH